MLYCISRSFLSSKTLVIPAQVVEFQQDVPLARSGEKNGKLNSRLYSPLQLAYFEKSNFFFEEGVIAEFCGPIECFSTVCLSCRL